MKERIVYLYCKIYILQGGGCYLRKLLSYQNFHQILENLRSNINWIKNNQTHKPILSKSYLVNFD